METNIELLQKSVKDAEIKATEATNLLLEMWKHIRMTDNKDCKFTIVISESLYNRGNKFVTSHGKEP